MTESQNKNESLQTEQKPQPINVEIQRLYVKEQSCKVPHGKQAFQTKGQPETSTEIDINSQPLEEGIFEVALHDTLIAKLEQRTLYQTDVQQAVESFNKYRSAHLIISLHSKLMANLIYHAIFPPVFLPHMDFSSVYQQRVSAKDTKTLEKIKAFTTQPPTAEETDMTPH